MITAVALLFIEHLEEDLEQCIPTLAMIGLAVDIEENGIRRRGNDLLQVCEQHGVGKLVREEIDRTFSLLPKGVFLILEKIRKHLDEV